MKKNKNLNDILNILYFSLAALAVIVALVSVNNRAIPESERTKEEAVLGGAFAITEYDMNITVNQDHSYDVEQDISVDIPKQVQNIKLTIPSGNFRISNVDVADTACYSDISPDTSSIVIVDPIRLAEGRQTFKIKYTVREFEERDKSQDIFYFTALPPEWKLPIEKVDIKVQFPADFPWDDIQCYAGQFGVMDVNNKVVFTDNKADRTVHITGERVPENYGITIKADLPDMYWRGALNGGWVITAILAVMEGVLLVLILLWFIGGRDAKIPKSLETKPIENIPPSEIGYIFNSNVSIRDILLLLLQFARRGYLSISEYEPKRYRIKRKEDPVGEEKLYRNAYNILFEDIYKDRDVEMEDLGERLLRVRDSIMDDIAAGYAAAESAAFTPLSQIFRYVSVGLLSLALGVSNALSYRYEYLSINYAESLTVTLIAAAALLLLCRALDKRESQSDENNILMEIAGGAAMLGTVVYVASGALKRIAYSTPAIAILTSSILAAFFIVVMRARGKENAELVMRLRQLREFIYHPTPKELLENHLADENYYYDMLQYALAFGAEESWAISFLTLNVPAPNWFSHDVEGYAYSNIREDESTLDYARDLKTFMRTIENAFADLMRHKRRRY